MVTLLRPGKNPIKLRLVWGMKIFAIPMNSWEFWVNSGELLFAVSETGLWRLSPMNIVKNEDAYYFRCLSRHSDWPQAPVSM